jgi:hypothetical protein
LASRIKVRMQENFVESESTRNNGNEGRRTKTKGKYRLKRFAKQLRIGKGYACETYVKGIK